MVWLALGALHPRAETQAAQGQAEGSGEVTSGGCQTPGCLDVMTCQCAQREVVADAEASTVEAIAKYARAIAEARQADEPGVAKTLRGFADALERNQWKRGKERGDG